MSDAPLPPFAKENPSKFTESPNPIFTYGQKPNHGKNWTEAQYTGWNTIDAAKADPSDDVRKLLKPKGALKDSTQYQGAHSQHHQRGVC
ncbi:hypothetical protein C8Q74DRAFT_414172 [Fomes fomentarius]|nr:hypothetical protein C8Q74DRAFT_414172 [Fomes fomentarius]